MANTDDTSQTDEAASVCTPLLDPFPTQDSVSGSVPQVGPSWAAISPLRGNTSPGLSLNHAPVSPPDVFWRLLPLAQGPQRRSTAAEGKLPAGQMTSCNVSTPSSTETVKKSPLTPFPAWRDESEGESAHSTEQPQQRHRDPEQKGMAPASHVDIVRDNWHLRTAMHGATLLGQCVVSVGVFSILVAVMVYEEGSARSGPHDSTQWNYLGTSLGLALATCVGVLALHETRVLSTVAMLYFQALILTVVTATSLALWAWIRTQVIGQTAKGMVVGGLVMMEVTTMLAFARATLVWWLLEDGGGSMNQVTEA